MMIRKATVKDLSRIAEIQIFNYRLYFYPIFKADKYYFEELQVPSLMQKYEADIDSVYVYDDGVVKGFIKSLKSGQYSLQNIEGNMISYFR